VSGINILSCEDVLRIHEALCFDFAETNDPIFPPGVKSQALLESAVGRQNVGTFRIRKHPNAEANAATLTFGLCNDHPFHNGNKRTSLVAMLAHLDRNHLTLMNTKLTELFDMILAVANHQMAAKMRHRRRKPSPDGRGAPDEEVAALSEWLTRRTKRVTRGERQVTYRELRSILRPHGYELGDKLANRAEVIRVIERPKTLLRRTPTVERKKIGIVGYHSEGEVVSIKTMKELRRLTGLTEENGCDSEAFYAGAETFDVFINRYRTILRRLARR
jgi:death-on-curing protein